MNAAPRTPRTEPRPLLVYITTSPRFKLSTKKLATKYRPPLLHNMHAVTYMIHHCETSMYTKLPHRALQDHPFLPAPATNAPPLSYLTSSSDSPSNYEHTGLHSISPHGYFPSRHLFAFIYLVKRSSFISLE